MTFRLVLNGVGVEVEGDPMDRLLDVLREKLRLTGTKEGCGEGECGACTVLLDGNPVLSCLVPLGQCEGLSVETVEGLAASDDGFMQRMVESGGVQCGACTPGVVVAARALLARNRQPSRSEIQQRLAGNICRCTGYEGIHRAFGEDRE